MPTLGGSRGGPALGGSGGISFTSKIETFTVNVSPPIDAQTFELELPSLEDSEIFSLNGVILHRGLDKEFVFESSSTIRVLPVLPLKPGDVLQISYASDLSSIIFKTEIFTFSSSNTAQEFQLPYSSSISTERVSLNGRLLLLDMEYIFISPGRVKILPILSLVAGDIIQVKYRAL